MVANQGMLGLLLREAMMGDGVLVLNKTWPIQIATRRQLF